jgi:2,3-bisphosphoglycerate-independent phosphoglycerate mutase
MERPKPLVLAILDGFGVAPKNKGNAIELANTPNLDKFIKEYPVMTLYASGNEVGLSFGEMGNSEVGHLNIGAGRVYYQTFPRIQKHIFDESFFENEAFLKAVSHVKENKSTLHIMGILSSGNVHGSNEHIYALLELAKREKIKDVSLHIFLDGRDATKDSGINFVRELEQKIKKEYKRGVIKTVSGRFWGLDRDNRWERIEKVYNAMVKGISDEKFENAEDAVLKSYENGIYDEEFKPVVVGDDNELLVKNNDAMIFANFRPDRARQITKAFSEKEFSGFQREYFDNFVLSTMTEYEKGLNVFVAYKPVVVVNSLAETISKAGLKQFHVAETEKYAHITFFLNGTVEEPFLGEERKIIPSPKVESYAEKPEMSANEITKEVLKVIDERVHDVIFLNFANADMVGHTGNLDATIKACEVIDNCLGQIMEHTLANDGVLIITADHGNAEEVINLKTNEIDKEHSNYPVPMYIIGKKYQGLSSPSGDVIEGDLSLMPPVGVLADVAPTMLSILGLEIPGEMTGRPLI